MNVRYHSEGAKLKPMRTAMGFNGGAPIWREIEKSGRLKWIGAKSVLCVGINRAIDRRLKVDQVVDVGVAADAADMRREGA
jgi:hypothetical protein